MTSQSQRNWTTVDYSGNDLAPLARLSSLVYGQEDDETTDPKFLEWLYFRNPAGRAITWAAIEKTTGVLVGTYSVVPLAMLIGGQHVTGSVSANLITHPEFRKQGIFKALGEAMHSSCAEAGIVLSVSLAHGGSYPGFIRSLKYHDLGRRVLIIKPLNLTRIIGRVVHNPVLARVIAGASWPLRRLLVRPAVRRRGGLEVEQVNSFGVRFDDLWARAAGCRPAMFVRSSEHLNWRYFGWPPRRYEVFAASSAGVLMGYVVTRTIMMGSLRATLIVDALADPSLVPGELWRAVMPEIERKATEAEADLVGAHLLQHDANLGALRALGYRPVPRSFLRGPHALCVGTYLNNNSATIALQYSSWYFMSGDNDTP